MPNRPQKVTKSRRSALKIESLETRQLLAGVTGAGTEVGSDIKHPNGNIYDQVLMTGSSVTVTADPGQVTRVSFLDASGDIVQAEFAGAGSLTVSLAGATGPVAPDATKYNQAVNYMKGTATFTIQGSDATTNFGVFSVGTATANAGAANPIFTDASGKALTGGNNIADVQRITIVADPSKPNGSTFGGIRAGNAVFSGSSGVVGISAAGVQVQDVVIIGDIDASGTAIPTLIFGTNSQFGSVTVSGGDLVQTNGVSIANTGSYAYQVGLTAGTNSGGTTLPAQTQSSSVNFTGSNPFNLINNTFNLTTAPDTIPGLVGTNGTGNSGNDTINGILNDSGTSATPAATFTPLDTIDGGTGTDTFNILDTDDTGGSAMPASVVVKNVEIVNARGADVVSLDTSTWTGVTSLNVTQAKSAILTAPSTTAVTVAGVTGAVTVNGGSTQSITSLQGGSAIVSNNGTTIGINSTGNTGGTIAVGGAVGGTAAPTGAVTISSTSKSAADLVPTRETFTATFSTTAAPGDTITYDGTTVTLYDPENVNGAGSVSSAETAQEVAGLTYSNWTASASGSVVTFTAKLASNKTDALATDFAVTGTAAQPAVAVTTQGLPASATMGAITVTGGTTVNVTESAGAKLTTQNPSLVITEGAVTVNGTDKITSVTVTQDPTVSATNAVTAVTSVKEVQEVNFTGLTVGQTATVGGLTFTAAKTLTAQEVAAAFANLTAGTSNGPAPVSNGTYTGTFATTFVSGAPADVKVTFTGATAGDPVNLTASGTGAALGTLVTPGVNSVSNTNAVIGVTSGAVAIDDTGAEADTLTTVSLSGFGAGSTVKSDALTTLTLASSTRSVTVTSTATSLGLTANTLGTSSSTTTSSATLTLPASITTLNLTATGGNSFLGILAGNGITTLNVNGSKVADLASLKSDGTAGGTTSSLTALTSVNVTDTAGLKLPANAAPTLTTLTSTSTGSITATVNPTIATVTTGAGADVITTSVAAPSKPITLGAGDDELKLASGTTSGTGVLDGGDGTDTLTFLNAADAGTGGASASATFAGTFQNFEKIGLAQLTAGQSATVSLDNLDAINYVVTAGSVAAKTNQAEVAVVTFAGTPASGTTLTFNGTTVTYTDASPTLPEFIAAVNNAWYKDWIASAPTATTLTLTRRTNTASTDLTPSSFTGTFDDAGTASVSGVVTTVQGDSATAAAGGNLSLTNMLTGGTVEITGGAFNTTAALKTDGTADVFNIVTKNAGPINVGTVGVDKMETVNLTATDTSTSTIDTHTITIQADSATAINITGNANVALTTTGTAVLATIDGSAMTGTLSATGSASVATTVKGGSANDTLTAGFANSTLVGGAGDDTLVVNGKSLVSLSGGTGNDTFDVSVATPNVNAYATVTDPNSGDVIKFAGNASSFASTALSLDPSTAVFQDYANLAIASTTAGAVRWFQFGGNTYIVDNVSGNATAFQNNQDIIVKVNGLVSLASASFNTGTHTLMIV